MSVCVISIDIRRIAWQQSDQSLEVMIHFDGPACLYIYTEQLTFTAHLQQMGPTQ